MALVEREILPRDPKLALARFEEIYHSSGSPEALLGQAIALKTMAERMLKAGLLIKIFSEISFPTFYVGNFNQPPVAVKLVDKVVVEGPRNQHTTLLPFPPLSPNFG